MRLFVANCTKQTHEFSYRVKGQSSIRVQHIPIGGQIQVTGDLSQDDLSYIVNQHLMYGMVAAAEFDKRTVDRPPLMYSVGKEVPWSKILEGMQAHEGMLVERGRKMREEAAVATNEMIEHQLNELPRNVGTLRELEVSAVEQEPERGFRDDAKVFAEGVVVTRDLPEKRVTRKEEARTIRRRR